MTKVDIPNRGELVGPLSLADEEFREYQWIDELGRERTYRINNPKDLYFRQGGGTTHRVVDDEGLTHCVPAPGQLGCVLRWKASPTNPVQF